MLSAELIIIILFDEKTIEFENEENGKLFFMRSEFVCIVFCLVNGRTPLR